MQIVTKKFFARLVLLTLIVSQQSIASIFCPSEVTCDKGICRTTPPDGKFYVYEIIGKQPAGGRFVRAYSRPQSSPHTICSYASKDRSSQVDLASNANLTADFSVANKWQPSANLFMCGHDFDEISSGKCPFIYY